MAIIRQKSINTRIERQIVIGMIMSTEYLSGLQQMYSSQGLRAKFAQAVAEWCLEYYEAYKAAPKKEISDVFIEKKKLGIDPDVADLIEDFLTELSLEYEEGAAEAFNVERLLIKTEEHFRLSALENHRIEITKCITGGRIEDGEAEIANFLRTTRMETKGIDPFLDTQYIAQALDDDNGDKLFSLDGALGNMLGPLERGWLFAIVAATGVGKTWWLISIAVRAMLAGCRVLFVSLEMSEKEMIYRIMQWACGMVKRIYKEGVMMPVWDCELNQTGQCSKGGGVQLYNPDDKDNPYKPDFGMEPPTYKPCTKCKDTAQSRQWKVATWGYMEQREKLTIAAGVNKSHALRDSGIVKPNRLKIVQFPSGELTMPALETYMDNLEHYEDFQPDVLITDSADKFKFNSSSQEHRHGIANIWEGHKGLSQKKNILVCTASHSNTSRSGKDVKDGDFNEDIRKKHEIDAGMALNQTPAEKREGIYRCSMMKARHDDFDVLGEAFILQCLKIGRPYLDSIYRRK